MVAEQETKNQENDLSPKELAMMEQIEQEEHDNQREKFGFDPIIETEMLGHLLHSPELLESCGDLIEPEWFQVKTHIDIVKVIVTLWKEHRQLPHRRMLEALVRDQVAKSKPEYQLQVLTSLLAAYDYYGDASTLMIAESKLLDFARRAKRRRVAYDLVTKEDDDDAVARLEAIKSLGNRDIRDMDGIEFLDYADSFREEWLVDGWLPRRVLCLFSGVQKLGKSTVGFSLTSAGIRGQDWFGNHVRLVAYSLTDRCR
jgi:hypothetical protein